jgi:predicted nucleic acid-binding protein
MIVLDANILIRAVLGRRVRHLLETYAARGFGFYAPDVAYADAERYLPSLLQRRQKPEADVPAALRYLQEFVEPVDRELYGVYEAEARERLGGRDEEDWPVLGSALALNCPLWTEDADFFGTGIAIWTTNRIEILLKAQTKLLEREEG